MYSSPWLLYKKNRANWGAISHDGAERQIPGLWQYGRFYGEPYNIQQGRPEADYVFPVDLVWLPCNCLLVYQAN